MVSALLFVLPCLYARAQTTFGREVRVNEDAAGTRQIAPRIAVGASRIIYVLWTDFRGGAEGQVYMTSSMDDGVSFATARPLTNARGLQAGMQRGAQFVVDAGGNLHLVWQESNAFGKISARYARSVDGGATITDPIAIAADSGQQNQDFPSIAVDSGGNPYIAWIDDRDVVETGHTQLYFTRSTDGGMTFQTPMRASLMPGGVGGACECCNTSIAVSPYGNVFISFRSNIDNNRDIYIARSLDRGERFIVYKAASESWNIPACPMTGSSICVDPDETAHVAWRDSRPSSAGRDYIYYNSLRREDTVCPHDARISNSPKKSNYPSIGLTRDGTLFCVYQDNRNDQADLYYTYSLDRGTSFVPDRKLTTETNTSKQELAALAVGSNGVRYVVWQDNRRDEGDVWFATDTTRLVPVSAVRGEEGESVRSEPMEAAEIDADAGQIRVQLPSPHAPLVLTIHTLLGELVLAHHAPYPTSTIDIRRLPAGRFLLSIGKRVIPFTVVR